MIDVRVFTLGGENSVQLDPSWPVSEVKRRLHAELHGLGIPSPETQKIVSLDSEFKLQELSITWRHYYYYYHYYYYSCCGVCIIRSSDHSVTLKESCHPVLIIHRFQPVESSPKPMRIV